MTAPLCHICFINHSSVIYSYCIYGGLGVGSDVFWADRGWHSAVRLHHENWMRLVHGVCIGSVENLTAATQWSLHYRSGPPHNSRKSERSKQVPGKPSLWLTPMAFHRNWFRPMRNIDTKYQGKRIQLINFRSNLLEVGPPQSDFLLYFLNNLY